MNFLIIFAQTCYLETYIEVSTMSIIQCAKLCKHQKDGYCHLEKISVITNSHGGCPHFLAKSSPNSLFKTADTKKLNVEL